MSSIFIPAKEILSHSYNLNAASEMDNVRFDDTYLDIINAAKVDISVGRNRSAKEAMLKSLIETIQEGDDLPAMSRSSAFIFTNAQNRLPM